MTINLEYNENPGEAQLQELASIHASCFPKGWSATEIADLMKVKWTFLVMGEGAFGIARVVAGEAEILTLAVRPEKRRQGLGKAILAAMEKLARTETKTMFLEVSENNKEALALYKSAGYSKISCRRGYYTDPNGTTQDAIVMRRSIG